MNLTDKTVLVTGASSGIGQAIAIACTQKGAVVLINFRSNEKGAKQTLSEVEKYSKGYIFQADITDNDQIKTMFTDIAGKLGKIDLLVNNAGDAGPGDFFDNEAWEYQFNSIFFSALHVSQNFLKQNKRSDMRKIVNITSYYGNSKCSNMEFVSYSVAKAALASMTEALAKIDGKVLVNAVAPGYTWTKIWSGTDDEEKKIYEARTVIGRYVEPVEIAQMVVGLLENDAITGQVVTVDGGLSLQKN